jgi:heat shock protein HtpX
MTFFRRAFYFLLVNFLVVITISIILNFFNIPRYLSHKGINYSALLIFCFIWGMGGAFISLLLSKKIAKGMLKIKIIKNPLTATEEEILSAVNFYSQKLGLDAPEIGIYDSNEVNAFATGASKNNALIALSSGIVNRMNLNEIKAVIGHEISHIANGDMVTMTLIQGIVNAFVMFISRVAAFFLLGNNRKSNSNFQYYLLIHLFEMLFFVLGSVPVAYFSRFREFRADSGSASLNNKDDMIAALKTLQSMQEMKKEPFKKVAFSSLKISSSKKNFFKLFATHPPIEKRIERLKNYYTSSQSLK